MNEPVNPYAAPAESFSESSGDLDQIEFETIVEKADITQVLNRPLLFTGVAIFTMCGFGAALLVFLGNSDLFFVEPGAALAVVGFQVMVVMMGLLGWNHCGPGVGGYTAMRDPSIVGPLRGQITEDAMYFHRDQSYGVYWLSSITSLRTNRRGLIVAFDSFRSRLFVLPRSAFLPGQFEAAVARLSQHFTKVDPTPLTGFDPRQQTMPDQPLLLETADDAVPYEGELFFSDLKSTRLESQLLGGKFLLFFLSCVAFGGGLFMALMAGPVEKMFALVLVGVGVFFLVHWLRLRRETRANQLVGVSKGVVDRHGVIDCTAIGQVQYGWWMFQWCVVKDGMVLLRTRGLIQYYIVLVKREFASDEQWDFAVNLIQQNVVRKRA